MGRLKNELTDARVGSDNCLVWCDVNGDVTRHAGWTGSQYRVTRAGSRHHTADAPVMTMMDLVVEAAAEVSWAKVLTRTVVPPEPPVVPPFMAA
jgi:hypothetical protein